MVCSACGYENHAGMRFCGMCGTPLPHRPLTTPGAQSTLNYTRVPVEPVPGEQERSSGITSVDQLAGHQFPVNGSSNGTSEIHPSGPSSVQYSTPAGDDPPAKELVPDISLDEYVQGFRYEPPVDPSEVTMRGDAAPIGESLPSVSEAGTTDPTVENATAESESSEEEPIDAEELAFRHKVEAALRHAPPKPPVEMHADPIIEKPAPPADSVAARLGLEPESPAEERVQRPRFLDINEPSRESAPAASTGSGTSSIVGPSFLGLSDAPLIAADSFPAESDIEDEPRGNHWRAWVAIAIVAIFVMLGVVQWRAQASQSNGPIQVIKAKLDSWRHGPAKPNSGDVTPPASDAGGTSSAENQVPSLPSPQASANTPAATQSPTKSPATNSTSAQTKPVAPSSAPATTGTQSPATALKPTASDRSQSPPTISNSESATTAEKLPPSNQGTTANAASADATQPAAPAVANPRPSLRADKGAKPTASGSNAPGAEEMSKAKNASDAAASAAWLWKATAKGNPDAPVQLADMYIKGTGVPRSCEQAVVLLKTAAAKENALARNRLASMYATGNCVQRNRVEAYRWVNAALSANPGSEWAQQNRELIWNQMTPDEQAAAQKYR